MTLAEGRLCDYLDHMLEAIARIERYTGDMSEVAYLQTPLVQDATLRNLEVLGEAANLVLRHFPVFADEHTDIPWRVMYTMRNRISHGYHAVDHEVVWNTLQNDLPDLAGQISAARATLPRIPKAE